MKLDFFISIDNDDITQGYLHALTVWPMLEWTPGHIVRVRSSPRIPRVESDDFTLSVKTIVDRFKTEVQKEDRSESLVVLCIRPYGSAHDYTIIQLIGEMAQEHGISEEDVRITYVVAGMQAATVSYEEFDRQRQL